MRRSAFGPDNHCVLPADAGADVNSPRQVSPPPRSSCRRACRSSAASADRSCASRQCHRRNIPRARHAIRRTDRCRAPLRALRVLPHAFDHYFARITRFVQELNQRVARQRFRPWRACRYCAIPLQESGSGSSSAAAGATINGCFDRASVISTSVRLLSGQFNRIQLCGGSRQPRKTGS